MVVDGAGEVAAGVVVGGCRVDLLPEVWVAEGGVAFAFGDEGDFDAVWVVEDWAFVGRHGCCGC